MKNILNETDKTHIISRINQLSADTKNLWGKMNVNEMICHVSDQIKLALGKTNSRFVGNLVSRTLLKWLILTVMPTPKGKVQTVKELNQEKEGTRPTILEHDRQHLIQLIRDFDKLYKVDTKNIHPAFGSMNKKQWGRLVYLHLDHHLQQFGV